MTTQTQQTDPFVTNNPNISYKPLKTAAIIGGAVLLSSDKTYPLTPASARNLAQQLQTSADIAEYSGQSKKLANDIPPKLEELNIKSTGKQLRLNLDEVKEKRPDKELPSNLEEAQGEPANHIPEKLPELPDKQTLNDELKLISVCQEIGGIAERNQRYTLSLTLHINKPVESLTVAQLLAFHRECNQRFNNLEGLPVSDAGAIPKLILGRNTPFDKDTPITELDWYDENGNMTHKGVSHA